VLAQAGFAPLAFFFAFEDLTDISSCFERFSAVSALGFSTRSTGATGC